MHQRRPEARWVSLQSHASYEATSELLDFFPRLGWNWGSYAPPRPLTPEFWRQYGEPVWEFAHYCSGVFGPAVDIMCGVETDPARSGPDTVQRAFRAISALALAAAPSFSYDESTSAVTEERVSAGLLASYALMFLWDFAAGRRCLRCRTCDRYFVSNDQRARYCSRTCRLTAQSRRYRSKRREERAQGAE
jgi:hypothetical protein